MKNTLSDTRVSPVCLKLFMIMKLTWILTVFCVFDSMANVNAQTITLNMQEAEISKVLTTIESQSNFRFLYNSRLRDLKQKVNVSFEKADIGAVMSFLFNGTQLTYKLLDNNLIAIRSEIKEEQDVRISGRISSESGEALTGVSVSVKGTTRGTTTDSKGEFTLSVPENAVLVISAIGYVSQEITVGTQTTIAVRLVQSTSKMDEVIVIGYGTATKRDLTGSISRVAGKEIADKPNTNPIASIQGKVAGVSVVNSGQPGQEPDIRIRGTVSRTQTKPLYVIDGLLNDNINFVNPNDIESMEILKDPSSLAIFGVRGANGVIIITTKKARTGQLIVNLSSSAGIKKVVDKVNVTDAAQFKMLYDEQRANQGQAPYANFNLYNGNSNWVDLVTRNGFITNNNISVSSGTEKNKFYMGLGYIREDGIIKHETLEKLLLSINDELKVAPFLKIGFNVNGYRATLPQLGSGPTDIIGSAINATPIVEPFNTQYGVYNRLPDEIGGPQVENPVLSTEARRNTDLKYEYRAVGNIYAEINFLKKFTFKATYYADLGFNNERRYTPRIFTYAADFNNVTAANSVTEVYQQENRYSKFQQEYLLTFKEKIGEHSLTVLGGFTTNYNSYTETNGRVRQKAGGDSIPFDKRFWYLDNLFGDPTTKITAISHGKDLFGVSELPLQWEQATVSYLFRLLYNYQGKYMLNASFRRDGSSDISPDNRYQNFVAVGAAWELTKENFMNSQTIFDFAKLKASWGILGNQYTQIHYPYYPLLSTGVAAVFGNPNNVTPAYTPSFLADPNLKWETVNSKEIGVEFSVLKNRLAVEVNYFNKQTDNLLTNYPGINGQKPGITNAGKIENKGIEASATWNQELNNGLHFSVSGNITTLNNKVKQLYQNGFEIIIGASRTTAGYPIGYFYGFVHDGLYQSYADKLASPNASSLGEYGPGDIKFKDLNGDKVIDDKDRTQIGDPTPDFIYGFSLSADYKRFNFGIDFQGVYGNEIFRSWGNGATFAVFNYRAARLGRWTGDGTSSWEPTLNDQHSINRQNSTYMIEDGSYIRIRNVQLGYNFDPGMLSKVHIKSLRVFVNGQNLKTFKRNSGFTPEFGGDPNNPALSFGVDGGSYPIPAIYSAGINVTF
jgi:TonB-linked SusC/RagA family outer membrane protein